jgi:hypothetical protein
MGTSPVTIALTTIALLLCAREPALANEEPEPAQPPAAQPKPVPRARWSEDWSAVRDPAPLTGTSSTATDRLLRPIKFIPFDEAGDFYLSLGGEYRFAYEIYDEADAGVSDIGFQDAPQHRVAMHASLHLTPMWRVFAQLGWADVNQRDGGAKTIDKTDIDVWQLFGDFRLPLGDNGRGVVRAGRQLIETANVFITAGEAHNIRLVYDGGRVAWIKEDFVPFEAFGAEYVDYEDGYFDMSGTGEHFWGLRAGVQVEPLESDLHFLYLGWDLEDRQFEQAGAERYDELRHTLLLWLNRPLTGDRQWGLDYYLAYQFGEYENPGKSDISAFAAFGTLTYAIFPQANTPLVRLKAGYFSGDRDPDDGNLNTFYNPVFGTPYFSYARDIMPFNLVHVQPNIGYRFGNRLLVAVSYEALWRAQRSDAYYNNANGILVRSDVSGSRWLGQQTQITVRYKPIDQIAINVFWSHLFAGDVIEDAGGDDRDYFHVGVNLLF